MTRCDSPRPRAGLLAAIVLCALLAALGAGCATKEAAEPGAERIEPLEPITEEDIPEEVEPPVEWKLSREASAIYHYLSYRDHYAASRVDKAEQALATALKIDPTPELHSEMVDFQWSLGRLETARVYLLEGLSLYPDNRELTIRLAETYLIERRYEDAAETLEIYLNDHPTDMDVRDKLAQVYIELDRFADAIDLLEEVPREQWSPKYYMLAAKAVSGLGLKQQGVDLLRTALDMDPGYVQAWAELAFLYEQMDRLEEAERTYSRILDLGEVGQEILFRLIDLNIELDNPARALKLVQQGPESIGFRLEAIRRFLSAGRYDQARVLIEDIAPKRDEHPEIYFYLALYAYEAEDNPARAVEFLDAIPMVNPLYERALSFKAHMLYELDRMEEVFATIEEGKARFPDSSEFLELEAWIYERNGQYEKALEVAQRALENDPGNIDLLYRNGIILEKLGNRDEALQTMERILVIDPSHTDALNFVGYTLADMNRDLDRAETLVLDALQNEPNNGYIVDSLAWVYYRQGRHELAFEKIEKALTLVKDDPTIWEHYGDIAAALGRIKEARRGYAMSLEIVDAESEEAARLLDKINQLP